MHRPSSVVRPAQDGLRHGRSCRRYQEGALPLVRPRRPCRPTPVTTLFIYLFGRSNGGAYILALLFSVLAVRQCQQRRRLYAVSQKKHPRHFRLLIEKQLSNFDNFCYEYFRYNLPSNDRSVFLPHPMYASALPREIRSSEICVKINRKPEKTFPTLSGMFFQVFCLS